MANIKRARTVTNGSGLNIKQFMIISQIENIDFEDKPIQTLDCSAAMKNMAKCAHSK